MSSATPLQRVTLPAQPRQSVNRSQTPAAASRGHQMVAQALPGSSRRQPPQPSNIPGSAQNYGAISSGIKVGRAGTSESMDLSQGFPRYPSMLETIFGLSRLTRITDTILHQARRSVDQSAGSRAPFPAN